MLNFSMLCNHPYMSTVEPLYRGHHCHLSKGVSPPMVSRFVECSTEGVIIICKDVNSAVCVQYVGICEHLRPVGLSINALSLSPLPVQNGMG